MSLCFETKVPQRRLWSKSEAKCYLFTPCKNLSSDRRNVLGIAVTPPPSPENCTENGKIARNLWDNCPKNWRNLRQSCVHVSWLWRQIWSGFCLGKIYNNTKVVSVAVKHSIGYKSRRVCFRRMCLVSTTSKFQLASC